MVDDCIEIERKRDDGKMERFSKPKDVLMLGEKLNAQKRLARVEAVLPTYEAYCEKYVDNPLFSVLKAQNTGKIMEKHHLRNQKPT
jgi:hypothetical protein